MANKNTPVPTASSTNTQEPHPLDTPASEFGKEAGQRIGTALAEEIHCDPETRRAAATGAGVGVGVVIGLGLIALATQ